VAIVAPNTEAKLFFVAAGTDCGFFFHMAQMDQLQENNLLPFLQFLSPKKAQSNKYYCN
jgi:hypothetical protein